MTLGRILPSEEMRKRAGDISRQTEWRLAESGKGPPRVRLTPGKRGRWGYPENLLNAWLVSRLEQPLTRETETA